MVIRKTRAVGRAKVPPVSLPFSDSKGLPSVNEPSIVCCTTSDIADKRTKKRGMGVKIQIVTRNFSSLSLLQNSSGERFFPENR